MRAVKAVVLALVVLAAFAAPAVADEASNIVRGGLQYVWIQGGQSYNVGGVNVNVDTNPGLGVYLAYEYRMKMVGFEVSANWSNHDGSGTIPSNNYRNTRTTGEFDMLPVSLAANFHVFGRSYVDLYLGPVVGWYFMSKNMNDTFGYGAQIGADWNLSDKGLALNTALKYMFVSPDIAGTGGLTYDVDPLSLSVGLAYRF
ncbi:MAG: outer membrane beta-barrel protein [Acidobacteria bacterium]|jgi:outer membrane protein W|nr:outer membrane beta-barrel protein [Acidobacteriota bacterium]